MDRDGSGMSSLLGLDGFDVRAQLLEESTSEWWLAVATTENWAWCGPCGVRGDWGTAAAAWWSGIRRSPTGRWSWRGPSGCGAAPSPPVRRAPAGLARSEHEALRSSAPKVARPPRSASRSTDSDRVSEGAGLVSSVPAAVRLRRATPDGQDRSVVHGGPASLWCAGVALVAGERCRHQLKSSGRPSVGSASPVRARTSAIVRDSCATSP
jgi:hypothetical protein